MDTQQVQNCGYLTQCVLILAVIPLLYWLRKSQFLVFKRMGIRGPVPNILFGNTKELITQGVIESEEAWTKKYGKMFGIYLGSKPTLYVSDQNMIQEITIKQFHKFRNRPPFPLEPPNPINLIIFLLKDGHWKKVRNVLVSTFTAAKLKQMFPIINERINIFVDVLENKASQDKAIDMKKVYENLTLDIIGSCFFGIDSNAQTDTNDGFYRMVQNWMNASVVHPFVIIVSIFPSLRPILSYLRLKMATAMPPQMILANCLRATIEQRRCNPELCRPDALQLMIDAIFKDTTKDTDSKTNQNGYDESDNKIKLGELKQNKLNDDEIIAQCLGFIFAGYDTVNRTMANTTYLLATHPNIQQKLLDEIASNFKEEDQVTYDSLTKLQYLDKVLTESMRLLPSTPVITRECVESCQVNGITIPKGMAIQFPVYTIHHDPQLWQDPDKFNPERFLADRGLSSVSQYNKMPFGLGPRHCLGYRFALMEMKMMFVQLLRKFRIVECNDTCKQYEYVPLVFPQPKKSPWKVMVKLEKLCSDGQKKA